MNVTTRHAAAARTRALARLRSITIGTAVAGLAGVAGFGTIAAISNSGVPPATVAHAGAGTSTTSSTTTTSTTTTSSSLNAAATPRPARAPAQVTTGSS